MNFSIIRVASIFLLFGAVFGATTEQAMEKRLPRCPCNPDVNNCDHCA